MSEDLPRYKIELWGGRWYIRGGHLSESYGPYDSRDHAHDVVVEVNSVMAEAEERVRRLLREAEG